MPGGPDLDELERQVESNPETVDVESLCAALASDEFEVSDRAADLRSDLFGAVADPEPVVGGLVDLLDVDDDGVRMEAVEALRRMVSIWPRDVPPLVAPELTSSDPRRRGGAAGVLGCNGSVAVRYHSTLARMLDDPDPRVAGLALSALSSSAENHPSTVAEHAPAVRPFLADGWIPDGPDGARLVYAGSDHESDSEGGEPAGHRLTKRIVRPFDLALSLLDEVASVDPETVEWTAPRLRALLTAEPERHLPTVVEILSRVARSDPATVDPAVPTLRRYADDDNRRVRIAARNLLAVLGDEPNPPEPIPVPEMVNRDRSPDGDVESRLHIIDERAMIGDVDLDELLPLLRSIDDETRDTVAWGLSCGAGRLASDVHERAESFLALLNEPHECTREHLTLLLGRAVEAYPEEWTPALVDLSDHDDPLARELAVNLLGSAAGAYPEFVVDRHDAITVRLDDDPSISAVAFHSLGNLAETDPDILAEVVPDAVGALDERSSDAVWGVSPRVGALGLLESLAMVAPGRAKPAAPDVLDVVTSLAAPDVVGERAKLDRGGSATAVGEPDRALKSAFAVCATLAATDPDAVAGARPYAERVLDGRYYGYKEALRLLVEFEM